MNTYMNKEIAKRYTNTFLKKTNFKEGGVNISKTLRKIEQFIVRYWQWKRNIWMGEK